MKTCSMLILSIAFSLCAWSQPPKHIPIVYELSCPAGYSPLQDGGKSFDRLTGLWRANVCVADNGSGFQVCQMTGCGSGVFANTKANVAHQWFNSYDGSTGLFTSTQPAVADISGLVLPQTQASTSLNWLRSYNATTGLFTIRQPDISDVSGTANLMSNSTAGGFSQMPYFTGAHTLAPAKDVGTTANGSFYLGGTAAPSLGDLKMCDATGSCSDLKVGISPGGTLYMPPNIGPGNPSYIYATGGTTFTASGCSVSALAGGSQNGKFTSGTTGACNVAITIGEQLVANVGYACFGNDQSTGAALSVTSSTTLIANVTVVTTSGDVVSFACIPY